MEKKENEILTLKKSIDDYVRGKKDEELTSVKSKVQMAEKEKKMLTKKEQKINNGETKGE